MHMALIYLCSLEQYADPRNDMIIIITPEHIVIKRPYSFPDSQAQPKKGDETNWDRGLKQSWKNISRSSPPGQADTMGSLEISMQE